MNICPVIQCPENVVASKTETPGTASRLNKLCYWPQPQPIVDGISGTAFPQVAASPVFVSQGDIEEMRRAVEALDRVLGSQAWAEEVLAAAPVVARHDPGNRGVLFGFDFHLTPSGPKLIEINTNAGGALISARLLRKGPGCSAIARDDNSSCRATAAESVILDSFLQEWRMVRGETRPKRIAIVDERPDEQYMVAEFQLFAELFRANDMDAVICDPRDLKGGAEGLSFRGEPVDLVYNRLTDFYLEAPELEPLRAAYLTGAVVLTPHPRAHALYADKRHMITLSDPAVFARLGVGDELAARISAVMVPTRRVRAEEAEALWRERRSLFFKPAGAYGGKGVYEGAKLTRTTFERLIHEDYVAQEMIPPPMRQVWVGDAVAELKYDVRCYVYRGQVQLVSARLFRGQATNFRTQGGGFAAVQVVPE